MFGKWSLQFMFILFCLLPQLHARAQSADSLRCDYTHSAHFSEAVAPSCLFACGTLLTFTPKFSDVNVGVRDWVQEKTPMNTKVDNYLQFAPLATTYALNACGLKGVHGYGDLTVLSLMSHLLGWGVTTGIKYTTKIRRPDATAHNSFPSGHTLTAFVGAEILRREFGREHPWIAVGGYTAAAMTGFMRMANNRHWMADVMAGAGLGVLSTSVVYWMYPHLRALLGSDRRCKAYVFYDGRGVQFGASLQLVKAVQNQLAALPDFSFADGERRGDAECGVAE